VKRPWLTGLLAIPIGFAYVVASTLGLIATAVVLIVGRRGQDVSELSARAGMDADFVSIGGWTGTAIAVPLIVLVAKRQALTRASALLGWKAPTARQGFFWLSGLLLFVAASDGLTLLLGREVVPRVMLDLYASADVPVLFWSTLIVAAPLFEELLFRGLMFQGLVETRLKLAGAAIVTSLSWSVLHVQYDAYGIASIFVGGLLLSAARHFTGSVLVSMAMHATMNFVATLEVVWASRSGGGLP
jgi:membrane protease YdiL (CAAX protease family)